MRKDLEGVTRVDESIAKKICKPLWAKLSLWKCHLKKIYTFKFISDVDASSNRLRTCRYKDPKWKVCGQLANQVKMSVFSHSLMCFYRIFESANGVCAWQFAKLFCTFAICGYINRINELTLELGFDCKDDGDHDDMLECHLACTANTKHLHGHELCPSQGLSTSHFFRKFNGCSEMQIYFIHQNVTLCPSEHRPSPEQARSWRGSECGPVNLSQLASNAITEKKKHGRNSFCEYSPLSWPLSTSSKNRIAKAIWETKTTIEIWWNMYGCLRISAFIPLVFCLFVSGWTCLLFRVFWPSGDVWSLGVRVEKLGCSLSAFGKQLDLHFWLHLLLIRERHKTAWS